MTMIAASPADVQNDHMLLGNVFLLAPHTEALYHYIDGADNVSEGARQQLQAIIANPAPTYQQWARAFSAIGFLADLLERASAYAQIAFTQDDFYRFRALEIFEAMISQLPLQYQRAGYALVICGAGRAGTSGKFADMQMRAIHEFIRLTSDLPPEQQISAYRHIVETLKVYDRTDENQSLKLYAHAEWGRLFDDLPLDEKFGHAWREAPAFRLVVWATGLAALSAAAAAVLLIPGCHHHDQPATGTGALKQALPGKQPAALTVLVNP